MGPMKDQIFEIETFKKALIQLVKGKDKLINRLRIFAKILNLPVLAGFEVLFWCRPSEYPPFTAEMHSLISTDDPVEYVRIARRLLKEYSMENFVELQAALMKDDYDLNELITKISSISIYEYDRIEEYIALVQSLDPITKGEFFSKLRTHEYIRARLVRTPERMVLLDGSNIFMLRKNPGDIDFVLEKLAELDVFYYPFRIIFDRNIVYRADERIQRWLGTKYVMLHSPADELIVKLALEKRAAVVSSDRFSEWNANLLRIDPRRFFE